MAREGLMDDTGWHGCDFEPDDMTEEEIDAYLERMEQIKEELESLMEDISWNRHRGIED